MKTLYPIIRRKRRPLIMEDSRPPAVPGIGLVVPAAMTPPAVERGLGEAVTKAAQARKKAGLTAGDSES